MKRIANNVAVATLLGVMLPQHKVKIVDISVTDWSSIDKDKFSTDDSFGLVYTVDEILHKIDNEKIARAAIHYATVNEGMVLLMIDTKHEVY